MTRTPVALALLLGASALSIASPAHASRVLFSTAPGQAPITLPVGAVLTQAQGTTQVQLDNGALASFVGPADFTVTAPDAIALREGSVTVVSPASAPVTLALPGGLTASLRGNHASASFTADGATGNGAVMTGQVALSAGGGGGGSATGRPITRTFSAGQFWAAGAAGVTQRFTNGPAANTPAPIRLVAPVAPQLHASTSELASNGTPVVLGAALANAGAPGQIVSAAQAIDRFARNPTITAFPKQDYALLASYATRAASVNGTATFRGAGADIVLAYFQYLARGRTGSGFLTAYGQILTSYLDLLRAGTLPSSFSGATQSQLTAYLAYLGRTDRYGALSTDNQTLLNAYLAFLNNGGAPNVFATTLSGLTGTFLDYVRAGNDPAGFAQISQSVLLQYLAIVQSGGIKAQLTAQNRSFIDAYIASLKASGNGLAFLTTQTTALNAYATYLTAGGLPSGYSAVDAATLRAYLEQLTATGLLTSRLGNNAAFLQAYLAFLQGGGAADQYAQLPANIAVSLNAYYSYLSAGGVPSQYTTLSQAQILAYLKTLQDGGAFSRLLGTNASFLADYFAYLATGANPDVYAGLPNVDLNAYAALVSAYVTYLRAGNLPSGYSALTATQIRDYLNALSASGKLSALLGGDATFLTAYLKFVQGGGAPDAFSGLPILTYQSYATALNAYYAFLAGGGKPSAYTVLTQADILAYLNALGLNGQFILLGANQAFLTAFLTYLNGGGAPDTYTALVVNQPVVTPVLTPVFTRVAKADTYNATVVLAQLTPASQRAEGVFGGSKVPVAFNASDTPSSIGTGGSQVTFTTAKAREQAGNAWVNIGRYTNGQVSVGGTAINLSVNQGAHYLVMLSPTTIPITGTIDYSLLAATSPTYALDGFAPGKFDGKMRVAFGANPRIALMGTIAMPDTTFAFGSAAQFSDVANSGLAFTPATLNFFLAEPATASGHGCNPGCSILFSGSLTGETGQFGGFTYFSNLDRTDRLLGAAIFGAPGTSLGTPAPVTPPVTAAATTYTGQYIETTNNFIVGSHAATVVATPDGHLDAFTTYTTGTGNNAVQGSGGQVTRDTNTDNESGSVPGLISWTRWAGGTTGGAKSVALPEGGGLSLIWAAPVTNLPTTGTLTYNLLGATAAATATGSRSLGRVSAGKFAVAFDTRLVGFEATIAIDNSNYILSSQRGSAVPTIALDANNLFSESTGRGGKTTITGGTCGGSCGVDVSGFLAGPGAQYAGLLYSFALNDGATGGTRSGVIAFGVPGAATTLPPATPSPTATAAPTGAGLELGIAGGLATFQASVVAQPSGKLDSYRENGSNFGTARGTTTDVDFGTLAGTIAWTRWTGGTTSGGENFPANGGRAFIWGTPATAIPTAGSATYTVAGSTQPAATNGSVAPGTLRNAHLAVNFASNRVGFDATVGIGGSDYLLASTGGIAAPSMALAGGQFGTGLSVPIVSGGGCTPSTCFGTAYGFLAGAGASFAGLSYRFNTPGTAIAQVNGAIAFAKGP